MVPFARHLTLGFEELQPDPDTTVFFPQELISHTGCPLSVVQQ